MRNNEDLFTPQVLLAAYQAQHSGQNRKPSQSGTSSGSATSASPADLDYAELTEMYQAAQIKAGKVPTDPLHDAIHPVIVKMARKRVTEVELRTGFRPEYEDLASEIWADLIDPAKCRFDAGKGDVFQYLYRLTLDVRRRIMRSTIKEIKLFNSSVDVESDIPSNKTPAYQRSERIARDAHAESVISQLKTKSSARDQQIIDRCSVFGESRTAVARSLGISTKTVQRTITSFIGHVRREMDPAYMEDSPST